VVGRAGFLAMRQISAANYIRRGRSWLGGYRGFNDIGPSNLIPSKPRPVNAASARRLLARLRLVIFGRSGNFRRKIIFPSATYQDQGPETELLPSNLEAISSDISSFAGID
jgi:hypothetical protein